MIGEDGVTVPLAVAAVIGTGYVRRLLVDAHRTAGVPLAVYGYSAAAMGRYPKSISVIAGTGLVEPTL